MDWEVHVEGRRYRLRNRRMFTAGLVLLGLFITAVTCICIGILASASGNASASVSSAPVKAVNAAIISSAPPTGQPSDAPTSNPSSAGTQDSWMLTLVNADHPLPEGFHVETRQLLNGLTFDARAYDDLKKMLEAGGREGLSFVVCSAYRSYGKQQELYDNKVARIQQEEGKTYEQACEEARKTVAMPGTSEHNLGLAADIVAMSYQQLDEGYLNTRECKWLAENSWKYGFIMRYPQDKKDITHIIYEPWHYRYVGVEAATAMKEHGQCLEEYIMPE